MAMTGDWWRGCEAGLRSSCGSMVPSHDGPAPTNQSSLLFLSTATVSRGMT